MGKSIVILNGSPRKKGNTSTLVKAFREGAESAGHSVTEFILHDMNIHGCKGCLVDITAGNVLVYNRMT